MTKRTISLLLALVMVFALFTGCAKPAPQPEQPEQGQTPAEPEKPKYSFGMVTDVGGIGDKSFNDSAWAGIEKAGQELGVEPKLLQSTKQDDYTPNLGSMAQSVDLTLAVGFLFEDAMKTSADQYADKKFGVIDTVVDKPNVMSVTFKEHEGSFLVGVIAGLTTKSNVIGFVGGMDFPVIRKFEAGFIAGVKSANPKAKVIVNYTGAFDNPDKGKEVALTQHQQKADVIFHASGACGIGVIQAADEKDFWAIGVDQDQAKESTKNKVLCSMIKRVDTATYTIIKAYTDDAFKGGAANAIELGLKEEGVGYSDNGKNVSAELAAHVEKYKAAINDGTIAVPPTREDLETFKPVEIK
ncbi:BMP family lipoprotein [Lutispora sp.]|uniref:BMP family lipoprotein n=1 Tax=Lutispora sp. TaxID=2828727 RepID=UPI002B1EC8B1|nr:BMP family ABC transporter substrate-binding protein [Lutispora sp.]MEA4960047.1 BMP family ABC transporter substrate-binding protein [Lutispora sp.]